MNWCDKHFARQWSCDIHWNIFVNEFGQKLAAHTARCSEWSFLMGHHGYSKKFTMPFANRFGSGGTFGTDRWSICTILNVTTGFNYTTSRTQCCTDFKITVRAAKNAIKSEISIQKFNKIVCLLDFSVIFECKPSTIWVLLTCTNNF